MEWVVTTGKTIDEAKDKALDELGVDEQEAEFEVIDEPVAGLFGRIRREAKVRARVTPRQPRPKVERRERGRRNRSRNGRPGNRQGGSGGRNGDDRGTTSAKNTKSTKNTKPAKGKADGSRSQADRTQRTAPDADGAPTPDLDQTRADLATEAPPSPTDRAPQGPEAEAVTSDDRTPPADAAGDRPEEGTDMTTVSATEQAAAAKEFLEGLLDEFGATGTVRTEEIDEDMVELQVDGDDLGLLIGPKGQTLNAIQELARTYVSRTLPGTHQGRIRLDVSGYRSKRRDALERFTRQIAEEVRTSGVAKSLEPMHPADRKVVHDTANDIEGVSTTSEGEEPRRRVVILPAED